MNDSTETDKKIDEILDVFRKAVFIHAMELGQEFPDEKPEYIFDPCNADDEIEAREKTKKLLVEERLNELKNLPWKRADKYGINSPYVTKQWLTDRIAQLEGKDVSHR